MQEARMLSLTMTRRGLFRAALAALGTYGLTRGAPALAGVTEIKVPDNVPEEKFDFDTQGIASWTTVDGQWVVEEMEGAPSGRKVLMQRATKNEFNVIVAPGGPYGDVDISMKFKPIAGREDASGGIVFRFMGIVIAPAEARAADPDWKAVEQALGKSGQLQPGDVFRVGMPRTDLTVTVKGVPVKAGFALGSYAAFKQMGDRAMVMGDLVLLDQEVPAVMSGLFSGGLEVTAVHNHLNEMSPHVMYMHYEGHGDAVQLAKALRQALSASGTPLGGPPATAANDDPAKLAQGLKAALDQTNSVKAK